MYIVQYYMQKRLFAAVAELLNTVCPLKSFHHIYLYKRLQLNKSNQSMRLDPIKCIDTISY